MGKKLKVGKTRKDKFYHLAKETGYRSRSSFKLIQLNRKFQFLQKARALLDLCAAPGGWYVAASVMADKHALKKELQMWKVDVVLNDGAPNVGANWQHDAFSQAHLTLMALKLACEFLNKGGTFITKVFRSKDYQPLMWIFQQFFKKVQATKPQASRNESAEIFVVCQGFLAPDKIDNKFFDPKHAFKEVEVQVKTVKELTTKKPKAEGYADGDLTQYHMFSATAFLRAENPVDFLSKASEITFDNPDLESHSATSSEIKECCKDIKVLGRKELRLSSSEDESDTEQPKKKKQEVVHKKEEDEDEDEDEEMEKKLAEMKAEEIAELKRKKKKILKERRKQRERVELKMDLPGVSIADAGDSSMFSLKTISKAKDLNELTLGDMTRVDALVDDEGEADVYISESESDLISLASDLDEEDLAEIEEKEKQMKKLPKKKVSFSTVEEDVDEEEQGNELLVDLEEKSERLDRQTSMWFSKDIFSELDLDEDKDALKELEQSQFLHSKQAAGQGKKRKSDKKAESAQKGEEEEEEEEEGATPSQEAEEAAEDEEDSDDCDSSDDEEEIAMMKNKSGSGDLPGDDDDFQVVPVESTSKRARILDAEGLALGAQIATSKKRRRDLIDDSFHRFSSSQDSGEIPVWFLDDERKHRKKPIPVTREMVEEYKQKWKEINARPIKRLAEAKARKKRRMLKKMEQAKKKAEAVVNTVDISEREKMAQLRSIYKKAGVGKEKREVTYVVAKKGAGRKVRRPPGVKGVFRVVDSRMKKDIRGKHSRDQKDNRKGGKKGGKGGRGGKAGKGHSNRK
ncbi:pre-rRNA processing protein FTSJ3 [Bagarius yarrelli]|uniref:pre-rRNA processing protein FTSJ3 n=1 Tax=Bagarius yarrelli TaxID=175774 RepID=A0A556TS97_BAGYA|nr:pre-rRNA processing protein FTSJ3 [Bagarius yarrelli]